MIISDSKDEYFLIPSLSVYTEGSKAVDVNLALDYYNAGKFRLVHQTNNEYINLGLVNASKWFALPLKNKNTQELNVILEFITSEKNSIACFAVSDTKEIVQVKTPEASLSNGNPSLLSRSQTFTVKLPPERIVILLFQTVNRGQLLYFPGHLYTVSAFRTYDIYKTNFLGLFKGIFLFIILFSLFLFFTTSDKVYLFYLLYAFFISAFALNEAGNAYFEPYLLKWLNYIPGQAYLLFGFSAWLLLMAKFLNLDRNHSASLRFIKPLCYLDILFGFIPVFVNGSAISNELAFQEVYQGLFSVLFFSNLIFIFSTILSEIRNKNKLAIFYALANVPVIAGTILYYTNYFSLTNVYFHWINPVALGLSIEIFLLSFGFAFRYQLLGKEKESLLQQLNLQQEDLTKQIIHTQESERKRIAQDIHDELGGNLAAINIAMQRFTLNEQQHETLSALILKAAQTARNISHNLMPPEFIETNLETLLKNYFIKLNKQEGNIKFYFHIAGEVINMDKQKELTIYRIILELTNNMIRHSMANEATVQLIYNGNQLELMAEDNGRGFDPNKSKDGIGLKNIQTRVSFLKGSLDIDTGEHGTTTIIQIPIYDEKN